MFTLTDIVQPTTLEEAYSILVKRKNNQILGGTAFLRMGKKRIGTGIELSNLGLDYIKEDDVRKINETKKAGKRVIAVGTTSCRVLETIADEHGMVKETEGDTRNIYISRI